MISFVKRISRIFFPKGSKIDGAIKSFGVKIKLLKPPIDHRYHAWTVLEEWKYFSREIDSEEIKFSIVTPAYNTPSKYLEPLLYSIVNQTYENWEWIVVDASSESMFSDKINSLELVDKRIKVIKTKNNGISNNTNKGLKVATGHYIILVDHDDTITAEALNELAQSIVKHNNPDMVYSDEDKLSEDGHYRKNPHLKSDLSIDLLRNLNYITHIVCINNDFLKQIGYLKPEYDGAQDYDLMLRAVDSSRNITYIPRVLYHWREADSSTARDFSVKPEVLSSGVGALREHLERNKINADVAPIEGKPGFYRISYKCMNKSLIELNEVNSKTDFKQSEYVLISPQDIIKSSNWQEEFTGILDQNPEIGIVCPVLINQFKQVVDSGQINKVKSKMFYGVDFASNTYLGDTDWVRNLDVSSKCVITRTSTLQQYFKSHKQFSLEKYSEFIKSIDLRITLWSFDPWILEGEKITNKNKSLANEIGSYRGYGNVK